MAESEGGPDMVSFRELARRLTSDGVVKDGITHQRISQIRRDDPEGFPPVVSIGRSLAVDYRLARPYFASRKKRQGHRTDLEGKAGNE